MQICLLNMRDSDMQSKAGEHRLNQIIFVVLHTTTDCTYWVAVLGTVD